MGEAASIEPAWCGGAELRAFLAGGLAALERCAHAVDRLNVFPVPDGDTGTNLAVTAARAARAAESCRDDAVSAVAAAMAEAALRHARGNSGMIFAQLCAGLAASVDGASRVDARAWADAWGVAADAAWRSVTVPVEGTLLTVAREAARAARTSADGGADLLGVWRAMADAADTTVAETPRLLAVLRDADVVDAGALGLALFLRGGLGAFTHAPLPDPASLMQPSEATRRVIADARFPRYCTQFLLHGAGVERSPLAAQFARFGDSLDIVVSVADAPDPVTRIHLHTDDPDAVLAHAATLGAVSGVKLDDMQDQRSRLLGGADESSPVSIVAVVAGAGMRRLFESLYGVAAVLERDGVTAPDAAALGACVAGVPSPDVLVLPNDERLVASRAAFVAVAGRHTMVVPTRNEPEGVAAVLAFDPNASLAENARAMTEAARASCTVRVAPDASDGGRMVATHDGRRLADGAALLPTAESGVAALLGEGSTVAGLVTIYCGAGVAAEEGHALATRLERRCPGLETEIVAGGQPDCPLWITVEGHAR